MNISSVYGPVPSWRAGKSLGIDLILHTSTCSFNCIYCQLGAIQNVTNIRRLFVSTKQVIDDFFNSNWQSADIITYSGSGEPTMATNLGEVIQEVRKITSKPQLVLTNGTTLDYPEVVQALSLVDRVYVKLDAIDEGIFQQMNRPVQGVSIQGIIENIIRFRQSGSVYLGIQIMFMPANLNQVNHLCDVLNRIYPDEVQLNTPTRPYPREWHLSSRGGHTVELRDYEGMHLRTISREKACEIEQYIVEQTGLKIVSVYQPERNQGVV